MEGLKELYALPIEKRNAIAETFESVENLYKKVFEIHKQDYILQKTKPNGYQTLQQQNQTDLYEIEDALDAMELDGHGIITEISSDHGEIIVNRIVTNLDNYLKQQGTTFEQMREWLKGQIGG